MDIPKLKLEEWSQNGLSSYLVDGKYIREMADDKGVKIDPDFTEGCNDLAPAGSWMPPKTIYIEDCNPISEMVCFFVHELNERILMDIGEPYEAAHENSNLVEAGVRDHPDTAEAVIADLLNNVVETPTQEVEAQEMPKTETFSLGGNMKTSNTITVKATDTIIRKIFRAEIKAVDEKNHRVYARFNADTRDRDNETCAATSWKKRIGYYQQHNVLVSSHDYSDLRKQIGEIELDLTKIDKSLEGWVSYYVGLGNEEADWAWELAQKNKAAFSVGFKPWDYQDGDGEKSPRKTFTDNELLEISQVIVPSSREALQSHKAGSPVEEILVKDVLAGMNVKKAVTQGEVKDELDYVISMVKEVGACPESKALIAELWRCAGCDKPVEIKTVEAAKPQPSLIATILGRK